MSLDVTLFFVGVLIGLGIYNWYLQNRIVDLEEQIENFSEMIMEMAKELQELGSPNVKVVYGEKEEEL